MATYEASVTRAFTADHSLRLPDGRQEESHQHVWRVTACFRCQQLQEPMGVVIDFVAALAALDSLLGELDGRNLNSLPPFADGRCSAELVAEYLAGRLAQMLPEYSLYRLSITEAPGCLASYYPAGA